MPQNNLYSIRMRASVRGRHVSGAEGIVPSDRVEAFLHDLLSRARGKAAGPDEIVLSIDSLEGVPIRTRRALDVVTLGLSGMEAGRAAAATVLTYTGVSRRAAEEAIRIISGGAAPSGENMRGAMIIDGRTGERLEADPERGVRVTRFGWSAGEEEKTAWKLEERGLSHVRTREALALATKGAFAPGVIAELCWSDDPDYTAGYVASPVLGYVRFPSLKDFGEAKGGRAYFVSKERFDETAFLAYMRTEAVLIDSPGLCRPEVSPDEFLHTLETGKGSPVR